MSLSRNPNQIHKLSNKMNFSKLSMNREKLTNKPKNKRLKIKNFQTEFRNQDQLMKRLTKKMFKMSKT
jgi:hypothetical protein